MFYGSLDLDLVCFCKILGVQIKMSDCAKKCTRAVGWTGVIQIDSFGLNTGLKLEFVVTKFPPQMLRAKRDYKLVLFMNEINNFQINQTTAMISPEDWDLL